MIKKKKKKKLLLFFLALLKSSGSYYSKICSVFMIRGDKRADNGDRFAPISHDNRVNIQPLIKGMTIYIRQAFHRWKLKMVNTAGYVAFIITKKPMMVKQWRDIRPGRDENVIVMEIERKLKHSNGAIH